MLGKLVEKFKAPATLSKYYANLDQAEHRLTEVKKLSADVDVDKIIDVVRSVADDDLTRECFAKYKDCENDKDPMKASVVREMDMFITNARDAIDYDDPEVSEKTLKLLDFVLENGITGFAFKQNPVDTITKIHDLAYRFQEHGGFALLATLEDDGILQKAVTGALDNDNRIGFASEFFEKISNDSDVTDEFAVARLRASESFQIACKSSRFLDSIRHNSKLSASIGGGYTPPSNDYANS